MSYHSELSLMAPYRTTGEADEARRSYPDEYQLATARNLPQPILTLDTVPPAGAILDLAWERHETALAHEDYAGARQLDRVRVNLLRGVALHFHQGDLLIHSLNNPGQVYSVNARGCTCPNGQAGRADCWHVQVYGLIEELHQAALDQRDAEAERAEEPLPYIVLSSEADGLHLTRGSATEVAASPAEIAPAIAKLTLGQRIAQARTAREAAPPTTPAAPRCCVPMVRDGMTWYCPKCKHWRWAE